MLRSRFPARKKARIERALEELKKGLERPTPPTQGGREPRDLNAYRERIKKEIVLVETKLKNQAS